MAETLSSPRKKSSSSRDRKRESSSSSDRKKERRKSSTRRSSGDGSSSRRSSGEGSSSRRSSKGFSSSRSADRKKKRVSFDGDEQDSDPAATRAREATAADTHEAAAAASTPAASFETPTSPNKIYVTDPNPILDPVVVSFPSGVPSSVLASEQKSLLTSCSGPSSSSSAAASSRLNLNDSDDESDHDETGQQREKNPSSSSNGVPAFTWHRRSSRSNRGKVLLGTDKTCSYSASNDGRGHDKRLTKLYVALYDKEKNTLQIRPAAEKGTVFPLMQSVTKYEESTSELNTTMANLTYMERKRVLFESFGSAKKQKVMKSQEANVVNVESVVGARGMVDAIGRQEGMGESQRRAIKEAMEDGTKKPDAVTQAYEEARRNFLPPFDAHADAPHRVYDVKQIAGHDAWNQLTRVCDAVTKKSMEDGGGGNDQWRSALVSKGRWAESVLSVLKSINVSKKSAKRQIKIAILLNHLVQFNAKCSKPFLRGSGEELCRFMYLPVEIGTRFLHLFATPTTGLDNNAGFAMSRQQRDKRLVHALILYVLANGPEMKVASLNEVAKDLKLELVDVRKLLEQAGFAVKKNPTTGSVSAALNVPLVFPEPKRRKL